MKSRKGFTLVELLAVIAILAILVIIALPNVINLFNKAQKEMFLTEARKVYSEAERKFLTESISGKNVKVINSEDNTKLDMTGKKLQYCIVLNNDGEVTSMKVSNGKWIASLDGDKTVSDLTVDDLEEGNLDNYECASATDESCFKYETYTESEDDATLMVTISDANKCKNYLSSNFSSASNETITIVCNGNSYGNESIHYFIQNNNIPSSDYSSAGLNVRYAIIEKVEVIDVDKCKEFYIEDGFSEEKSTKLCTTNESVDDVSLFDDVEGGYIPNYYYEKVGLKVTSRPLETAAIITEYDTSCGTDVVIPSKINGYNVAAIARYAFEPCGRDLHSITDGSNYKVNNLYKKSTDQYSTEKMEYCIVKRITSVSLPDTLTYIGDYAFEYNSLTEVIIPSYVKYIGKRAFAYNNLKNVNYNGNENNITFGNCPFYGNYDYPKHEDYCHEE